MSRSVAWRRQLTDAASWHQDEALNATIYILREMGPTGFLLKEEGETKTYKVYLGDPHSCTCHTFKKERDLCKHICWVLLRKFRVSRQNEVTWQLGLVEREVNGILRGAAARQETKPSPAALRQARVAAAGNQADGDGIPQRPIGKGDVCPICQEEFLEKHLPVTYCKLGCGNSIHIKCMKVWADHQKTQGEANIKCPLCREDFGPFSLLQAELRNSSTQSTTPDKLSQHPGTACGQCHATPIVGKCYKCTECVSYYLCQNCFITPVHGHHSFQFRETRGQRWRAAPRGVGTALPPAVVNAMLGRELGDADYETLLQLDNEAAQAPSGLAESVVSGLGTERVRDGGRLTAPGRQCRVCLQRFRSGQCVRRLPCNHRFHRHCIDDWLLHQHATCPVDGTAFTNQSLRAYLQAETLRKQQRLTGSSNADTTNAQAQGDPALAITCQPLSGDRARGGGTLRTGNPGRAQTVGPEAHTGGILVSGTKFNGYSEPTVGSRLQTPSPDRSLETASSRSLEEQDSLSLGIGGHQTLDTSQRPPSGSHRQRGGSASSVRGRDRTRGRLATRDTTSSPNIHELYLGSRDHQLVMSEARLPRPGSGNRARFTERVPSRGRAASNERAQSVDAHLDTVMVSSTRTSGPRRESNKSTGRLHRGSGQRTAAIGSHRASHNGADLYIGNSEASGSPKAQSPARLRHGHGPRETENLPPLRNAPGSPSGGLYIGADPASSEGFVKRFILNSISQKYRAKTPPRLARSGVQHRDPAGRKIRWGEVREFSGDSNSMALSGSRVEAEPGP